MPMLKKIGKFCKDIDEKYLGIDYHDNDIADLKRRMEELEMENKRLRSKKSRKIVVIDSDEDSDEDSEVEYERPAPTLKSLERRLSNWKQMRKVKLSKVKDKQSRRRWKLFYDEKINNIEENIWEFEAAMNEKDADNIHLNHHYGPRW